MFFTSLFVSTPSVLTSSSLFLEWSLFQKWLNNVKQISQALKVAVFPTFTFTLMLALVRQAKTNKEGTTVGAS